MDWIISDLKLKGLLAALSLPNSWRTKYNTWATIGAEKPPHNP